MASESQLNSYRCDQCGAANVVAARVLYQEGTRTYSGPFYSGVTQSYAAHAVAPPKLRGYIRPFLLWGLWILLFSILFLVNFSLIFTHPRAAIFGTSAMFAFLDIAFIAGLLLSLRRVAHYNREVYSRLYWNWEHTFICRRCGRSLVIPS